MMIRLLTNLYDYQQRGEAKLLPSRVGALFMEMGTGKTAVSISMAIKRQSRINRVVVFCPVSLKETWEHEIRKHTDTPEGCVYLFDDKTRQRQMPRGAFWYIVGIESMSASDRVALAAHSLITTQTMVIVDESDYIKGHNALRTLRITRYSETARYRLILTGTPMSQGYQDLFAQMRFLSPKILGYGSFYSFAANHLEYSEKYPGLVVRAHNTAWLAAKIQPYVYQITKEDAGLDLPPKLYDQRYYLLSYEQREAYERAKWEILAEAEEVDSYVIFQLFGALQQIVSGFWNKDGRLLEFPHERLERTRGIIERLPDEKVIIWCKFRYSVERLTEMLAGVYGRDSVVQYYGDLSEKQRSAELSRFRQEARFFVATSATGGHGLTLTDAAYTIFYENEFKFAHRLQAEDRTHRIGQIRRPTYIDVLAQCGIEQRIMNSHQKKGDAVADFKREVGRLKDLGKKELKEAIRKLI